MLKVRLGLRGVAGVERHVAGHALHNEGLADFSVLETRFLLFEAKDTPHLAKLGHT